MTDTPAVPIRKSSLPTTPPPEFEFHTVYGARTGNDGCALFPGDTGPVVVRRRVTYGDWEPVHPDRWADEPQSTELAVAPAVVEPPADRAALRDRIAEVLRPWLLGADEADVEHAADAVLAVLPPPADRAELDSLGREADRLRKDWVEMRARTERVEAEVQRLRADRAAVLREAADAAPTARIPFVSSTGRECVADWLRRMADETAPTETHACDNCEGVDPDTCFNNPTRPPEQCPRSEFEDYGQQCQKPAGHNLCTFEEQPAAGARQDGALR